MATSTHHERRLSAAALRTRLQRYREQGILGVGLAALAIAHLADVATTVVGMAHPLVHEGHPATAAIFEAVGLLYGIPLWTAYKLAGAILVAVALHWLVSRIDPWLARPAVLSFYGLLALFALLIAIQNLTVLRTAGAI